MMMDDLCSALDWTVAMAQRHDSDRNIISNNNNRLLFVHNLAQPQSPVESTIIPYITALFLVLVLDTG